MAAISDTVSVPAVPALINNIFQEELNRFISGETRGFSIDSNWRNIIGQQGINEIANRFSEFLKAAVSVKQSGSLIVVNPSLTRKPDTLKDKQLSKGTKAGKIARPPNSFILYRKHHHPIVKEKHPEYHNITISKVIGFQWRNEDKEVKEYYNKLAEFIRNKHAKDFPEYSYTPRKASEKKRRMSPRKVAQLGSLDSALNTNKKMAKESQIPEAKAASTRKSTTASSKGKSLEPPATDNVNYVPNPAVQYPLPKMKSGMSEEFTVPCPEFSFGDPTINPETFGAMIERYNRENHDRFGGITAQPTSQNQAHRSTPVAETIENELFDECDAFDKEFDWVGYDQTMALEDKFMNGELFAMLEEPGNATSRVKPINTHAMFSDPAAEVRRQEALLSPFLRDD